MTRRIAALLLVLALCVALLPTAALAGDETVIELTQANHTNYLEYPGTGYYTVLKAGTYKLTEDIALGAEYVVAIEDEVTLDLNGFVLKYSSSNWHGNPITVQENGTLTLKDSAPKKEHHFNVLTSGLWELDEEDGDETVYGGVLTSNVPGDTAGGIHVAGGTFIMDGGNIVGCTGYGAGGVSLSSGKSSFTMNGGSIIGCCSYGQVGGVENYGEFTMNGGTIRDCKVLHNDSGKPDAIYNDYGKTIYANGGDVYGSVENYRAPGTVFTNSDDAKSSTIFYSALTYYSDPATGNIVDIYLDDDMKDSDWYAWSVVHEGGHLGRPADPNGGKKGHYAVWAAEEDGADWNFESNTVSGDMKLYFDRWEKCIYTITWEANGGTLEAMEGLEGKETKEMYDNLILQPTVTKDGCTLESWCTDEELTKPWDFATDRVEDNMTLYAKWDDGSNGSDVDYKWLIAGGLAGGLVGASDLTSPTFADVAHGSYYYNAVEWARNKGVAGGVDSKHFAPDESCTRAQAVTMLWRAAGCPDIYGANPFVDVSADDYYYEAVLWAVAMGITSGTDETHFSPDEPCTRGQIVTFLHRAARCYQAHENYGFVDVKTGSYCEDAINWAVEIGITNGTGVDTFSPDSVCTRAQIVTFLYRNR